MNALHRRQFIKRMGLSAASLPFLTGLPSLGLGSPARPRQRLVIMFSPNGTIPPAFWPDETGKDFKLKEIMAPLEPFKQRMLVLHGLSNKVRGDGDTDRADPWTRMSYGGANKPIAPISDPYQMCQKLYGQLKDKEQLGGILDAVREDLKKARKLVNPEDRRLLEEHETLVRQMEKEIAEAGRQKLRV